MAPVRKYPTRSRERHNPYARPAAAARQRRDAAPWRHTKRFCMISWNMQGGGSDVDKATRLRGYMQRPDVDAICLQECGDLFNWGRKDKKKPEKGVVPIPDGWRVAIWKKWSVGGKNGRCSLAILTKAYTTSRTIEATWTKGRPMVGVRFADGLWVYSLHAPASGNAFQYTKSALKTAQTIPGPVKKWVCAGDFNLPPQEAPHESNAHISRCGEDTQQKGRELDYAYASTDIEILGAQKIGSCLSDHYSLIHKFKLTSR